MRRWSVGRELVQRVKRRDFLGALAVAGVSWPALGASDADAASLQRVPSSSAANRPLVVTSKTNPAVREAITRAAWEVLAKGGRALDAAERATNVSERDPRDRSVGYGGRPNEDGFLQLDASVMDGATNGIGAVASLENIKTPCSVARLVMERTDHWLLAGAGALRFAKFHGFKEEDLLTEESRKDWVRWKETLSPRDYYNPPADPHKPEGGGTINVLTLDAAGNIAGITSTVGHAFKIVGRVGDSPIIGAGLYVDNAVGAAGATGHGEESVRVAASFLVVEKMREGQTPDAACRTVCERVLARHGGKPMFSLKLVALNKQGQYGSWAVRGARGDRGEVVGLGFCVHDANGHRLEPGGASLPPLTADERDRLPPR